MKALGTLIGLPFLFVVYFLVALFFTGLAAVGWLLLASWIPAVHDHGDVSVSVAAALAIGGALIWAVRNFGKYLADLKDGEEVATRVR